MGKRKRNKEARAGQEESNLNYEARIDSAKVRGKKKNQKRENDGVAGQSLKKKGSQGILSGQSVARKPLSWTSAQGIVFLKELVKLAKEKPSQPLDNSSINWEQLAGAVGERLDLDLSRTQIYEKARRLKERYTKIQENASCGNLSPFKNKDDEKLYKLSQKVWGTYGAQELQVDEEHDLASGNLKKGGCDSDQVQLHHSLLTDTEVETMQKEHTSKDLGRDCSHANDPVQQSDNAVNISHKQGSNDALNTAHEQGLNGAVNISHKQGSNDALNTAHEQGLNDAVNWSNEQANPDLKVASQLNIHVSEGVINRTIEVFYSEHQALLKDLQKSCMTVLQDMEVKFSTALSNIARGGRHRWMGVGARIPSVDLMLQDPVSCDKMAVLCPNSTVEGLSQQWQQQRLQELKLTSMKLQLMLDKCKRERETLEKQVLKP